MDTNPQISFIKPAFQDHSSSINVNSFLSNLEDLEGVDSTTLSTLISKFEVSALSKGCASFFSFKLRVNSFLLVIFQLKLRSLNKNLGDR